MKTKTQSKNVLCINAFWQMKTDLTNEENKDKI